MAASSDPLPPPQDAHTESVAPQRIAADDADSVETAVGRASAGGDGVGDVAGDRPLVTANPDRAEKLLALRRAIVQGTYTTQAERIARRLLDEL